MQKVKLVGAAGCEPWTSCFQSRDALGQAVLRSDYSTVRGFLMMRAITPLISRMIMTIISAAM